MKVRVKEKLDHLESGSIYEIVNPYSPLEKTEGYIKNTFNGSLLLIMPDTSRNGHFIDAYIKSWWVPRGVLEIIEQDNSASKLRVGQRWRWNFGEERWIVEIMKVVASESYATCKIIQVISGSKRINTTFNWNFDSQYWEYLDGQDRPT